MTDELVLLDEVNYRIGKKDILSSVTMTVSRNEIVALIGENGSGKTTLLSIIAGLLQPSKGQLNYSSSTPKIALVTDKPALYPDWTVDVFLHWAAEVQGAENPHKVTQEVVERCALQPVLGQACKTLSHGYRQRVSLARALTAQPDILLLDEPGNGLDHVQKLALREILRHVREYAGILMVHHDIAEVIAIADRVYDLRNSRCLPVNLPEKDGHWLWCQWQNHELAQKQQDADVVADHCTGYRCPDDASRQEKLTQLSAQQGITHLGFDYPLSAFQAQREAVW